MPLEHADACVEVVGGQVRVAHRHLQRLMAEPHLHAAYVDAALDQSRSAGVSQYMGNHVRIRAETDLVLGLVPCRAEGNPRELLERTLAAYRAPDRRVRAGR